MEGVQYGAFSRRKTSQAASSEAFAKSRREERSQARRQVRKAAYPARSRLGRPNNPKSGVSNFACVPLEQPLRKTVCLNQSYEKQRIWNEAKRAYPV
eukprot:scaffold764_cov363-Pavlova_lutheri.AAC.24